MFAEYLVSFDYLIRIMENYGFQLADPTEINLPSSIGSFQDLFYIMMDKIKKDKTRLYGEGPFMNTNEKRISFLNNYFILQLIHLSVRSNVEFCRDQSARVYRYIK